MSGSDRGHEENVRNGEKSGMRSGKSGAGNAGKRGMERGKGMERERNGAGVNVHYDDFGGLFCGGSGVGEDVVDWRGMGRRGRVKRNLRCWGRGMERGRQREEGRGRGREREKKRHSLVVRM